jgi:hypothetical protein
MIKIIAIAAVVLIAALLIFAATRPNDFRVQRSIDIKAAPDKVFAYINDFHRWGAWSPWEKVDPGMKRSYSGPDAGKGAGYAWDGNSKVGSGSMEIIDNTAPGKIVIKLDFAKPLEGHNTAEFTLDSQGGSTHVTWAMFGPSPFISKLMGVFFNMDRMIGGQFEIGLSNLKAAAEQ